MRLPVRPAPRQVGGPAGGLGATTPARQPGLAGNRSGRLHTRAQPLPAGRNSRPEGAGTMPLSARNQLRGTVENVKTGAVMAEITVNVEAGPVIAAITDSSRERLNLKEGDQVTVVIKATEVMIATD